MITQIRSLTVAPGKAGAASRIVFVQNFFDEVRRRAPAQ
jgi:hypothetical protein